MKQLQLPISGRYLVLPVRRGPVAGRMRVRAPGLAIREFDIELGDAARADYEVFTDLGAAAGTGASRGVGVRRRGRPGWRALRGAAAGLRRAVPRAAASPVPLFVAAWLAQ